MAQIVQEGGYKKSRYVVVYVCIMVIAALQFVVAYSGAQGGQLVAEFLTLAIVEAVLAVLFFMHLWVDSRGLLMFVGIFTVAAILGMQYGWPDAFRQLYGVPWAH
ncbi:MAG TPA: cytochrome C oxidase subunit IV family protein [Verrucomicrobiae bacterium]|jgi:heme/copper-type cytochrome/quinol oxidase subunit 4|nr:cytochrome C oxidase subunit IV family protein [Verrucomicrobiae bacterium]